jgi:hypothetical protein
LTEKEEKEEFVRFLLETPDDPFKAALALHPDDVGRALRIAHEWPQDKEVRASMRARMSEGEEEDFLPTKAELARKVWAKMNKDGLEADEFAKIARLYGEIRGFIEKPTTNISTNTNVLSPVMVVKDNGSDDEWERKLAAQQSKLVEAQTGS